MKLHRNEKSFNCTCCGKLFADLNSCQSHTFLCLKREKKITESGVEIVEFENLEVIRI